MIVTSEDQDSNVPPCLVTRAAVLATCRAGLATPAARRADLATAAGMAATKQTFKPSLLLLPRRESAWEKI